VLSGFGLWRLRLREVRPGLHARPSANRQVRRQARSSIRRVRPHACVARDSPARSMCGARIRCDWSSTIPVGTNLENRPATQPRGGGLRNSIFSSNRGLPNDAVTSVETREEFPKRARSYSQNVRRTNAGRGRTHQTECAASRISQGPSPRSSVWRALHRRPPASGAGTLPRLSSTQNSVNRRTASRRAFSTKGARAVRADQHVEDSPRRAGHRTIGRSFFSVIREIPCFSTRSQPESSAAKSRQRGLGDNAGFSDRKVFRAGQAH